MDTGELVLIGLLGGAGLWFVLRKSAAPAAAPAKAPCNIGGSYAGFGVATSCEEAEKLFVEGPLYMQELTKNAVSTGKDLPGDIIGGIIGLEGEGWTWPIAKRVVEANKGGYTLDEKGFPKLRDKGGFLCFGSCWKEGVPLDKGYINVLVLAEDGKSEPTVKIAAYPGPYVKDVEGVPVWNPLGRKATSPSSTTGTGSGWSAPRTPTGITNVVGTGTFAS